MVKRENIKLNMGQVGIFLLGIFLLICGIYSYKDTKSFFNSATALTGTIVEINQTTTYSHGETHIWCNPTIEFKTDKREIIKYYAQKTKDYKIGDKVTIYYNEKYKPNVKFASWNGYEELWIEPVILIGIGVIFSLAGISVLISILRKNNGVGKINRKLQDVDLPLTIKPKMDYPTVMFIIILVFVMICGPGFLVYLYLSNIKVPGETIMIIIVSIIMFLAMGIVVLYNNMYKIEIRKDRLILKNLYLKKEILFSDTDSIYEDTYSVKKSVYHKLFISVLEGQKIIDFYSEVFNRYDIKNMIDFVQSKIINRDTLNKGNS